MDLGQHDAANTELQKARRKYKILLIVKGLLSVLLIVLGVLSVTYTRESTDTFGPPYYLGTFLVGFFMTVSGILDFIILRFLNSNNQSTRQKLARYTCFEVGVTVVFILCGFIGIFIVALNGLQGCDTSSFLDHCNYNVNIGANRRLAIAILVFLIVAELLGIANFVVNKHVCTGTGPFNMFTTRSHMFNNTDRSVVIGGASGTVNMASDAEHSPMTRGYGHNNYRRDENYSADNQIIIGGQVIKKNRGGFSGAVIYPPPGEYIHQPQPMSTIVHPPVGYNLGHQGATSPDPLNYQSDTVNQLQEQNRLLREQIALQQQHLQLMQNQQQQNQMLETSTLPPPPPSYESCLNDPAQIKFLQQQNEELQNRYQTQQHLTSEKTSTVNETHPEPSAPPM